jgi:hypothetical protein
MSTAVAYSNEVVSSFVEALGQLSDDRDRRRKRHNLAFIVAGVVFEWTFESVEPVSVHP